MMRQKKAILTITGSDGTGGSGVQADIRFIHELGGVAASAITSITVQNTLGIQEFYDLPASAVRQQVEAIINDLQPQVVKVGLLRRIDVV
ncbi:MAG: bifunctional hydroxymethylpyrimidine kinase/phosphomethylpyrimidine kinase, partial [Bacteroidaceae bacterium]|nr:bifunctional hydroxymethylpyrimidine kinase/phosphomethylpyrimidine kinase [Bacteroidaceae bacterium]